MGRPVCLLAHSQNWAKLQKTSTNTAGGSRSWVAVVRDVNTARSVSLLGHTPSSQQYGRMVAMSCSRVRCECSAEMQVGPASRKGDAGRGGPPQGAASLSHTSVPGTEGATAGACSATPC